MDFVGIYYHTYTLFHYCIYYLHTITYYLYTTTTCIILLYLLCLSLVNNLLHYSQQSLSESLVSKKMSLLVSFTEYVKSLSEMSFLFIIIIIISITQDEPLVFQKVHIIAPGLTYLVNIVMTVFLQKSQLYKNNLRNK